MKITAENLTLYISLFISALTAITALFSIAKSRRDFQTRTVFSLLDGNRKMLDSLISTSLARLGVRPANEIIERCKEDTRLIVNDRLQLEFANLVSKGVFDGAINSIQRQLDLLQESQRDQFLELIRTIRESGARA